ncbi:hypothetical protein [Amycolatopsis suaedae]|uniref:Ceramidase n=1 Tax=Amycolatopsis suaedae TaxID=2510978 RepID=A0A4Q7JBA8_9PSEU|nr:hypothetical protein [Amycolatopsis suaedae]RZQ65100.1 hypothetical protein EWH70_04165 [Amycolatopsis suaedae]
MDWTAYVDGYCERLAPGFWAEPLNAVSNLSFLVATVATWRLAGRSAHPRITRTLSVLLGLIFLASSAFHTLATRWAGAADTGFILVFVLFYAAAFTRLFLDVRWRYAWLAAPAFLAVTVAFGLLGIGGTYLPALIGLFVFAGLLAASRRPEIRRWWPRFAVTGGVFGASLALRTADHSVCGSFPPGTHFLWHLLNGLVLYLVSAAAALAPPPPRTSG